jgi:hypothetical protein
MAGALTWKHKKISPYIPYWGTEGRIIVDIFMWKVSFRLVLLIGRIHPLAASEQYLYCTCLITVLLIELLAGYLHREQKGFDTTIRSKLIPGWDPIKSTILNTPRFSSICWGCSRSHKWNSFKVSYCVLSIQTTKGLVLQAWINQTIQWLTPHEESQTNSTTISSFKSLLVAVFHHDLIDFSTDGKDSS